MIRPWSSAGLRLVKPPLWKYAVVGCLCVAYAVHAVPTASSEPMLLPDSSGYLTFAPVRLLGYPLFLRVLGADGAVVAQPLLYTAVLASLGIETLLISSSLLLASSVMAAAILNPLLDTYHASILTESLSMALLVLLLAAMIRFVRQPSRPSAVWVGIVTGAAAVVRPMAYALIPVVLIMLPLSRPRGARLRGLFVAVAVPILVMLVAERLGARVIHKQDSTSLMGRVVFAKAAMVDAPPPRNVDSDPLRATLERTLDATYSPVRLLIGGAPSSGVHQVLTLYYEACLQWTCVESLRQSMGLPDARVNDLMRDVGMARIGRAPLQYVALWFTHLRALWTAYPARHPDTAEPLNTYLAMRRPLPFESDLFGPAGRYTIQIQPYRPAIVARALLLLGACVTAGLALLGVTAVIGRRALPAPLAVASLASLTVHGSLMLTAALTIGTSRFMVSVLPAVIIAMLFAGWWLVERVQPQRGSL